MYYWLPKEDIDTFKIISSATNSQGLEAIEILGLY